MVGKSSQNNTSEIRKKVRQVVAFTFRINSKSELNVQAKINLEPNKFLNHSRKCSEARSLSPSVRSLQQNIFPKKNCDGQEIESSC